MQYPPFASRETVLVKDHPGAVTLLMLGIVEVWNRVPSI